VNNIALDRNPSFSLQAVVRGVNGVSGFLAGEVRNEQVDPRLGLSGVHKIALEEFARSKDVTSLLIDG